jgi:hypothetical protein
VIKKIMIRTIGEVGLVTAGLETADARLDVGTVKYTTIG